MPSIVEDGSTKRAERSLGEGRGISVVPKGKKGGVHSWTEKVSFPCGLVVVEHYADDLISLLLLSSAHQYTHPLHYPLRNTQSKSAFPPKYRKQHTSTPIISPRRLTQHLFRQLFEILQVDHPLQRRHILPRVPHALLVLRQRPRCLMDHGGRVNRPELLVWSEVFFECVGWMEGFEYLAFGAGSVWVAGEGKNGLT